MLHERVTEPIAYEFGDTPDAGESMAIAPGIRWLRMPLPFALEHINLWLLEDDDRWAIVDSGIDNDDSRAIWSRIGDEVFRGAPVGRVILTHMHPDHAGCAGWLCRTLGADLWMSREEYLLCRVLTADTGREAPPEAVKFYRAAGFPPESIDRYQQMFGMFGRFVSPLPESFTRLEDGGRLDVGGHRWEVIVGRGHSPEHACLFDADRNLLISGDQLLPTISSNVSVFPTEPAANPLDEWLRSLSELKDRIPDDVLVLPAHGRPFRGAHRRLDQLIAEHERGLEALLDHCRKPRRVVDVFGALFRGPIRDGNLIMATGESIAHLNYLLVQGAIERCRDDNGVDWYHRRN